MARTWLPVSTTLAMPCIVQADSNIPLSGLIEVDGVALQVGDRVLARGQTNPVQNGVYVAGLGAWQRASDMGGNFTQLGSRVYVIDGLQPGEYAVTTENPVLGVTSIEFISVQAAIFAGLLPDLGDAAAGAFLRSTGPETPTVWHNLTKADVGLPAVDNTTDMGKPVSTLTHAEIEQLRTQITALINTQATAITTGDAATASTAASNLTAAITALTATKGQASGIASLDSGGKVPVAQIPAISIVDVFPVANQAAQLALTAQKGDVAIRSDESKSYVQNGGTAGTMADWTWLQTPTDVVLSVAGRVGAITLTKADVGLSTADNTPDTGKPVSTAQAAAIALKMPILRPMFEATGVGTGMVTVATVWQPAIRYNLGGGTYAAGVYTCPIAGYYTFDAKYLTLTGYQGHSWMQQNGVTVDYTHTSDTVFQMMHHHWSGLCAAGDTWKIIVQPTYGMYASDTGVVGYNKFWGQLIG